LSVREEIRAGEPVFEVMVIQDKAIKPTFYDLASAEPIVG